MQNIHVKRYEDPGATGFLGSVEPEDRKWIVFVHNDGTPNLWLRVKVHNFADQKTEHAYASAEYLAKAGIRIDDALSGEFDMRDIETAVNPPSP